MPNLHIRGVSEETIAAFKHKAEQTGKSLNETVREALDDEARAKRRREAFAELDEIRKRTGQYTGTPTLQMIREDRDSR
ncbi:MAG: FitA-like ribbon-helix-helix domain-containing protein [Tagaea sp.]